jgi:HEAT repeat protein
MRAITMTDKPRRADTSPYWESAIVATGNRRADDPHASDTRSTSEIIAAYIDGQRNEDATGSLATVHYRGGPEEFRAGLELLSSTDPHERAAGADVLAQLGWRDRTFLEESVDALLRALRDPEDSVVQSAIFALGHRESPRAITALLPFVEHRCADFRYAAVHGLMPHDTPIVVDALTKLLRDADRDVRDWATFTLGSQFESDSPALRAALRERVEDSDPEIRGEALRGLARRGDKTIAPAILRDLEGEFHGDWAVEAAALLGDSQFLSALRDLHARLRGENAVYFRGSVESAIAACEGRRAEDNLTLQ